MILRLQTRSVVFPSFVSLSSSAVDPGSGFETEAGRTRRTLFCSAGRVSEGRTVSIRYRCVLKEGGNHGTSHAFTSHLLPEPFCPFFGPLWLLGANNRLVHQLSPPWQLIGAAQRKRDGSEVDWS